jgi:hypothetical protein
MAVEDDRIAEIVDLMESWEWDFATALTLMEDWGITHDELIALVRKAVPRAPRYEPLRVAVARVELERIDRFIAVARKRGFADVLADFERLRSELEASIGKPGPLN